MSAFCTKVFMGVAAGLAILLGVSWITKSGSGGCFADLLALDKAVFSVLSGLFILMTIALLGVSLSNRFRGNLRGIYKCIIVCLVLFGVLQLVVFLRFGWLVAFLSIVGGAYSAAHDVFPTQLFIAAVSRTAMVMFCIALVVKIYPILSRRAPSSEMEQSEGF